MLNELAWNHPPAREERAAGASGRARSRAAGGATRWRATRTMDAEEAEGAEPSVQLCYSRTAPAWRRCGHTMLVCPWQGGPRVYGRSPCRSSSASCLRARRPRRPADSLSSRRSSGEQVVVSKELAAAKIYTSKQRPPPKYRLEIKRTTSRRDQRGARTRGEAARLADDGLAWRWRAILHGGGQGTERMAPDMPQLHAPIDQAGMTGGSSIGFDIFAQRSPITNRLHSARSGRASCRGPRH